MGKNKRNPSNPPRPAGSRESWLGSKGPALRFVLFAGGFMFLFYAIFYSSPEESPAIHEAIQSYLGVYASAAGFLLELLGFRIQVVGPAIFIDGTAVQVARGCDAMEPIALYIAAVIAIGVPLRAKLWGLGLGVPLLMALNLMRIVALSIISVRKKDWFDAAHLTVGQTVFVLCTLALWFVWIFWAMRAGPSKADAEPA